LLNFSLIVLAVNVKPGEVPDLKRREKLLMAFFILCQLHQNALWKQIATSSGVIGRWTSGATGRHYALLHASDVVNRINGSARFNGSTQVTIF